MNTTPLNNQPSNNGKKWTKASVIAALAAGAISVEAANLLMDQMEQDPDQNTEEGNESAEQEQTQDQATEPTHEAIPEPEPAFEPSQTHIPEPEPVIEPIPEPEPASDYVAEPEAEAIPEPEANPEPEATTIDPTPEQLEGENANMTSDDLAMEANQDDIVDVIVEEIDPQDIDMADVLLVDEVGTVFGEDGSEMAVAHIHDQQGNESLMVDVDGDNVYDVIQTPDGDVIAHVSGDIDVSDAELMYAQQNEQPGCLEQNDFDIAMNEENTDIQDDISLS